MTATGAMKLICRIGALFALSVLLTLPDQVGQAYAVSGAAPDWITGQLERDAASARPPSQLASDARPKAVPYYTPKRKTATRSAIMDAARIPISKALGQPVIFLVDVLRTDNDWAYLQAVPLQTDGSAMKWSTTPFARDWKDDMMSDVIMILLRKKGRGWSVVDHVIGPTDVFWYGWIDEYGLPEALFR